MSEFGQILGKVGTTFKNAVPDILDLDSSLPNDLNTSLSRKFTRREALFALIRLKDQILNPPEPLLTPEDLPVGPGVRKFLKENWGKPSGFLSLGLGLISDPDEVIIKATNMLYRPEDYMQMRDNLPDPHDGFLVKQLIDAHRADNPTNQIVLRIGDGELLLAPLDQLALANEVNTKNPLIVGLDIKTTISNDILVDAIPPYIDKARKNGLAVSCKLPFHLVDRMYDQIYCTAPRPMNQLNIFHAALPLMNPKNGKLVIMFDISNLAQNEMNLSLMEKELQQQKRRYEIIRTTARNLNENHRLHQKVGSTLSTPGWIPQPGNSAYDTISFPTLVVYGSENKEKTEQEIATKRVVDSVFVAIGIFSAGFGIKYGLKNAQQQREKELIGTITPTSHR